MRSNLQVEQMCELHGLYRHWIHPTVNELKGCETVKNIAQNRPTPDKTPLDEMLGLFKRQFVVSFIGKHGRWPRCEINDQSHPTPLSQAIMNQLKAVNLHSPHYPLCDWAKIEFLQEFEFDYHADYTDLIDDKSLSVELSSLRTIYNPDSLGYQAGKPSTDRRCVREILQRETVDVKQICDIIRSGLIPDNWKIVLVHSKERELNGTPPFCNVNPRNPIILKN
jgi:hypothetical protein